MSSIALDSKVLLWYYFGARRDWPIMTERGVSYHSLQAVCKQFSSSFLAICKQFASSLQAVFKELSSRYDMLILPWLSRLTGISIVPRLLPYQRRTITKFVSNINRKYDRIRYITGKKTTGCTPLTFDSTELKLKWTW